MLASYVFHFVCLGIAYVGFKTEKDLEQALRKNKNFIGGKRVFLKKADSEEIQPTVDDKPRPWELKVRSRLTNPDPGNSRYILG